jgi:predicted SnoaL-like aldol condensation-catalyzing enzyme
MSTQNQKEVYIKFYETLTPYTPKQVYEDIFDTEAYFEDPFQKVNGVGAIYKVFEHMYENLVEPKFKVLEAIGDGDTVYLRWEFTYKRDQKSQEYQFVGVSRVLFNSEGKVTSHIDYWDAASNIYEKIPMLGSILRWIKGKINA